MAACLTFAAPSRALEVGPWRMLANPAPFPVTFAMPIGVYDAPRHRVLAVDARWNTQSLVVYSLELEPEPRWSVLSESGFVPVRPYQSTIVLDTLRDRLLVVGNLVGDGAPSTLGVWALNLSGGLTWDVLETQGAPGWRSGHSSVYDAAHDRLLVFGGMGQSLGSRYLSDVWELSLATLQWTERPSNGSGPSGREGHGVIYDPERQRMLMFGGHDEVNGRRFWNDTWALSLGDTLAWSEIPATGPLPGARSAFGSVYDPVRRRMLVHGGINAESGIEPDNLWALSLDGPPEWVQIQAEDTLRGRSYPLDAYDPVGDRFLACGGAGYPQVSALSLATPTRWDALLPPRPMLTPGPRTGNAVVRDSRRDRFVVAGGSYSAADSAIWMFEPDSAAPWRSVRSSTVPGVYNFDHTNAVVFDSLGDRFIAFSGTEAWTASAERPTVWVPFGAAAPGVLAEVGSGAGLVLDARRNRLLVTGGWRPYPHGAGYTYAGICALSLDASPTWTLVGRLPQSSAGHSAYVDEATDRLVVLGGYYVNDLPRTRIYYGATSWSTPLDSLLEWTEHRSASGPLPLAPPQAYSAFDQQAGRLFIATDSTLWTRDAFSTEAWDSLPLRGQRVVARSAITYDAERHQILALYGSAPGAVDMQAWAIAIGAPSVELLEAARTPGAIALRWRSAGAFGRSAAVERREDDGEWESRGPLVFPVTGIASFTDSEIEPGHDYSYRVTIAGDTTVWSSNATFVPDASVAPFAMHGARPNPTSGDLRLWFRLPDSSPARIEVFDVRGRRCARREVGTMGPGAHSCLIAGSDAWRSGVYFVRLTRGAESRSARVVLVR